jgi:hypothetical protein
MMVFATPIARSAKPLAQPMPAPGADTITFDPSLNGTPITLSITGTGENANATGDLDITR